VSNIPSADPTPGDVIVNAVLAAVTAAAPAAGPAAPFVVLGASAIKAIMDLVPDKAALVRELAAMRAETDAALAAKHGDNGGEDGS
jgi:hypothetical protein